MDITSKSTLYDFNKEIIKTNLKPLNELEICGIVPKISEWFNMDIDCYAMLLCYERRDFTIFHMYETQNQDPPAVATRELIECLKNRGSILSIDLTPDRAWEIWIKIDEEPYCYYLFRYDDAVIEC